ncbi:MAG: PKD domain-containing protein [Flavobacteriaceae bacterium]|nr:PKD domain-containing protein [Flavobacteriaceae bacterium]
MKIFNNNTLKSMNLPFVFLVNFLLLGAVSCEKFELPESGSIQDLTPPSANFSAVGTDDYLTYNFSNTSKSATDYVWTFPGGSSSTANEPSFTFPSIGTYTVSLEASDKNLLSNTYSAQLNIVEPPIPPAINPEVLNGDFADGSYNFWKIASFTGGTRNPYNGSSDGESLNYDGSDNGGKTAGAKWTNSTKAIPLTSSSRFAYQAHTISPGRDYFIEYSYAVKTGGLDTDRVVVAILPGHYSEGQDALAATPIVEVPSTAILDKGNFTLVKARFTAPESGLVSIWMYGVSTKDAYIDNVKLYSAD